VSLETLLVSIEGWYEARCFRVIGGENGALRAVYLVDNDLRVFSRLKGGGDEWVQENLVRFPGDSPGNPTRAMTYETKKETKKIREITSGCLSMLSSSLLKNSLLYA